MKYFTLIFFILPFFSCKQATVEQDGKGKYFEGFVEFKVSFLGTINDTTAFDELKRFYGQKEITYLGKGGFICREFIDSNNIILHREVYRPDSLKFYDFSENNDSIFTTDVTHKDSSVFLGIKRDSNFTILGNQVEAVSSKTIFASGDFGIATYYNDIRFKIHPLVYKNVILSDIEEMFSHAPYLTTGYRMQYSSGFSLVGVATRVVPTHVEAWHFEIPKNKVIIEQ